MNVGSKIDDDVWQSKYCLLNLKFSKAIFIKVSILLLRFNFFNFIFQAGYGGSSYGSGGGGGYGGGSYGKGKKKNQKYILHHFFSHIFGNYKYFPSQRLECLKAVVFSRASVLAFPCKF